MKRLWVLTVVVALAALVLGSSASARSMKGKASFEANGGYAAFAFGGPDTWYDYLADWTDWWSGTVDENNPPSRAIPYGVKLKYGLSDRVSVTASAGAFSSKGNYAGSTGWGDDTIDTTVSATFFGAGAQIVLLDPPDFNIFTELEGSYWAVTYDEDLEQNGWTGERKGKGNTWGGKVSIGGEYFLGENTISLIGKLGYRIGKVDELKTEVDDTGWSTVGDPLQTVDPDTWVAEDMKIDLNGLEGFVGVCFYFR